MGGGVVVFEVQRGARSEARKEEARVAEAEVGVCRNLFLCSVNLIWALTGRASGVSDMMIFIPKLNSLRIFC